MLQGPALGIIAAGATFLFAQTQISSLQSQINNIESQASVRLSSQFVVWVYVLNQCNVFQSAVTAATSAATTSTANAARLNSVNTILAPTCTAVNSLANVPGAFVAAATVTTAGGGATDTAYATAVINAIEDLNVINNNMCTV